MKKYSAKLIGTSIIVALAMLTSATAFATSESTDNSKFIPGDMNKDAVLNISDATLIQKALVDDAVISDDIKHIADFNGDDLVSVNDATELQKKIVDLDYTSLAKPSDSYKAIKASYKDGITLENKVEFENLIVNFDNFMFKQNKRDGVFLIKSLDEFFDLFDYCSTTFDKTFFEDNALIVWTTHVPANTDIIMDNRELTGVAIDGTTLQLEFSLYEPFYDSFWMPYDRNYDLISSVKQSDVKDIDSINFTHIFYNDPEHDPNLKHYSNSK